MRKEICCIMLVFLLLLLLGTAYAEMPLGFQMAMNNGGQKEVLCVKNYDAGATMTEAYTNFEKLDRNTEVRTRSYDSANSAAPGGGFLEASINSNVIGNAHIAWQSYDPQTDSRGRHQVLGRSFEDLTGVFSIEKFIQLWSNSSPGEISIDWLPCN